MATSQNTFMVARRAFERHKTLHPLTHYTGILSLHALARLALVRNDKTLLNQVRAELLPFVHEEHDKASFRANFTNYYCGGNGTALLHWQGHLPEAEHVLHHYAEDLVTRAPRDSEGIFCLPRDPTRSKIWIDVAFAVTPFLLFAGLALAKDAYVEEAFQQTSKMIAAFRDPENGLLHQCRSFRGPGKLSKDHWSRGNGWALLALAELVHDLPQNDPRRPPSERMFVGLVNACLKHQDQEGMWHQEITDHGSYVETSGSGLILYAIGVGLEKGLLPDQVQERFLTGLRGYLRYIGTDGSVYHTCRGCLCPGNGTILDYKARPPVLNDPHAFGPVTLAFAQALCLGISQVEPIL